MTDPPVLRVDGLRVDLAAPRWCGVSLEACAGTLVRLSGPSGCGKTTTLRAVARLQARRGGTLQLNGADSAAVPAPVWRRAVAYLPQRPVMLPGTVEDNLRAGATLAGAMNGYDPGAAQRWCDALRLPRSLWTQDARTLSGGEAARVALVRAWLTRPTVLLLDECTAALDDEAAAAAVRWVGDAATAPGACAVVVAHNAHVWGDAFAATVAVEHGP